MIYLELFKEIKFFDDHFEDGVFSIPDGKKVKVRALYEYCKEKGVVAPDELSEEELKMFVE